MKTFSWLSALFLSLLATAGVPGVGGADAQAPGSWSIEASASHVFSSYGWQDDSRHVADGGTAWNATIGRQTLPWLGLTGEGGLLLVDEMLLGGFILEDRWTVEAATHATLMMGMRLEPPVDSGLVPSLEIATGPGWLQWGDRHVTSMSDGQTRTIAGDHDVAWSWSAAFRLRFVTRRRIPSPQVVARALGFDGHGHPIRMITLGFGLRY